jgi:hypothetical protein
METYPGPVVLRAMLKGELVRLRHEARMTQAQVAAAMEWSEAKLIRIEGGKTALTKNDLEGLLKTYSINSPDRIEELLQISRESKRTAWWDQYRRQGIGEELLKLIGYEAGALSIRQTHNGFIPGLLQTERYAEVVTREHTPPALVDVVVKVRMERRKRLQERDVRHRPRETYILDESVIRRRIGVSVDPEIMVEQLYHLIELGRDDKVDIHVIPFSRGSHFGLNGPFTLLGFDALDDVLYIERAGSTRVIEGGDVITEYADAFFTLLEGGADREPNALDVVETRELIRAVAEEMRAQR